VLRTLKKERKKERKRVGNLNIGNSHLDYVLQQAQLQKQKKHA
jgi:hypothetical protein